MERLTGKQAQNMMEALASVYDVINEMDERSPEANAAKQEAAKLAAQKRREATQNTKQPASSSPPKKMQTADSVPTKKSDKPSDSTKNRTPVTAGGGAPEEDGQVDRYRRAAQERARKQEMQNNSADLFDIVKGHLIDEGLTEEEALKKMLTLTDEERSEIIEGSCGSKKKKSKKKGGY